MRVDLTHSVHRPGKFRYSLWSFRFRTLWLPNVVVCWIGLRSTSSLSPRQPTPLHFPQHGERDLLHLQEGKEQTEEEEKGREKEGGGWDKAKLRRSSMGSRGNEEAAGEGNRTKTAAAIGGETKPVPKAASAGKHRPPEKAAKEAGRNNGSVGRQASGDGGPCQTPDPYKRRS